MQKPLAGSGRAGFTIVELLIVIVVIAILAAISIVAYTGIQNRANDTAVQSDLKNFGQKVMEFQVLNGRLPSASADFTPMGLKASRNSYGNHYLDLHNMAYCVNGTAGTFAIVGASKSANVFVFRNGAVHSGTGPLETIANTCSNNGHPTPGGSFWFYAAGSWQSYIGG